MGGQGLDWHRLNIRSERRRVRYLGKNLIEFKKGVRGLGL